MKKLLTYLGVMLFFVFYSCKNETVEFQNVPSDKVVVEKLINESVSVDGVSYKLNDVEVNQNVVFLNDGNCELLGVEEDMYKLKLLSSEQMLQPECVIYIQMKNDVYLRKVRAVKLENGVYELDTEEAYLGDLFQGGSLELSVDVQKREQISRGGRIATRFNDYENIFPFDIFSFLEEYKTDDGLTVSPNTSMKAFVNLKIGFGGIFKIIPNEVVLSYELHTNINPYFRFAKSCNKAISFDFMDAVPDSVIALFKKIDVTVDVPLGVLGTLPARIGIDQIYFPNTVLANVGEETDLQFNANGVFKIGFAYYANIPGKESHIIYENEMTSSGLSDLTLNGEVTSNSTIKIIPRVVLVNMQTMKIEGEVNLALKTLTYGGISSTDENKFIAGSRGIFYGNGNVAAKAGSFVVYRQEILNETKELWNIGKTDNNLMLSNLRIAEPLKTTCGTRSYTYNFTVDYRYPVLGRKISDKIEVLYDVYDAADKILSASKKMTVQPTNVTDKSFTFSLCVPFKFESGKPGNMQLISYLKNFRIKDYFENEAMGITDLTTNAVSDIIEVGSPFNTDFWVK